MLRNVAATAALACSRSSFQVLRQDGGLALPAAGFASAAAAANQQHTAAQDAAAPGLDSPPASADLFSQAAGQPTTYRPAVSGSVLKRHGRDLTADAAEGRLDPLIGRQDVLERVLQVLLRRTKNNPVLIGDPGVGKTAVAEGIAQLIVSPAVPPGLGNRSLIALDVGSLVSGTQYRGAFEERITSLLNEVRMAGGRIILFIDELHMLMDAGRVEGGMNAANLLKPALARGDLHCIGATTVEEYRKHIEQDGAFARRFQPVMVEEPTPEEAVAWMHGLRQRYERYHGVRFTDEALSAAVKAAQRYIPDRHLPDSAIDVIDEAAARTRLHAAAAAAAARQSLQGLAGVAAGGIGTGSPSSIGQAELQGGVLVGDGGSGGEDHSRRLEEWLAASTQQTPTQQQPAQHTAAAPGAAGSSAAPAAAAAALPLPVRGTGLSAGQETLLSCPHCGTLAVPQPGSETVTCSKCRFTFLSIPQEKLMLGASLFLKPQQAQQQQQAAGVASTPATAAGAAGSTPLFQAAASTSIVSGATQPLGTPAGVQIGQPAGTPVVQAADVLAVVAEASGIPLQHISQTDWQPLADLDQRLRRRVAGQEAAVAAVVGAVRLGRLGLQSGKRPLASLLLTGPAGVGRSTLCLALAEALFGSDRHLLRFNMAEFGDRASVSRLVGAPPGYVGYGDGGLLTDAVRRRPHSVVLLERVDRAHPEVLSLITQVLESGQLQDSMGKRCSFRNAVVVLATSPTNVLLPSSWASPAAAAAEGKTEAGSSSSSSSGGGGSSSHEAVSVAVPEGHVHPEAFASGDSSRGGASHSAHSAAAQCMQPEPAALQQRHSAQQPVHPLRHLPAELLSRLDAAVSMQPLSEADMQRIVQLQLAECQLALELQGVRLTVDSAAQHWLAARGLSPVSGAQRLQPLLRDQLLLPVADALLQARLQQGSPAAAAPDAPLALTASVAADGSGLKLLRG